MISIQNTSGRHLIEKLNINSSYPSYPAFFGNGELYVVTSNKSSKKVRGVVNMLQIFFVAWS